MPLFSPAGYRRWKKRGMKRKCDDEKGPTFSGGADQVKSKFGGRGIITEKWLKIRFVPGGQPKLGKTEKTSYPSTWGDSAFWSRYNRKGDGDFS